MELSNPLIFWPVSVVLGMLILIAIYLALRFVLWLCEDHFLFLFIFVVLLPPAVTLGFLVLTELVGVKL